MAQFKWQDRFDIGVKAMNDDHKELLALMDKLEDLARAGADSAAIRTAMSNLATCTTRHFADEEKYMDDIQFPQLAVHKQIHARLLAKLSDLQKSYVQTGALPSDLFDFLNMWLASHICGIDIKYGEHSRGIRKAS